MPPRVAVVAIMIMLSSAEKGIHKGLSEEKENKLRVRSQQQTRERLYCRDGKVEARLLECWPARILARGFSGDEFLSGLHGKGCFTAQPLESRFSTTQGAQQHRG